MSRNLMGNFQRDISYYLKAREDGRIGLTATMKDVYHDIVMVVLVNGESLVIEAAEVEFHKCPENTCVHASERLRLLVGVTIGKGLNKKIVGALGGGDGCGNLRNMLLALLPLAMNVKAAEGFSDEKAMLHNIKEKLTGSCAGYPVEKTA
jgi:hypothetical protein